MVLVVVLFRMCDGGVEIEIENEEAGVGDGAEVTDVDGGRERSDTTGLGRDIGLGNDEKKLAETETKVPIIMYHYVRNVDKNADPLGWNLSINPGDFEKQLAWLKEQGYRGVHLADLMDGKVPEKGVVLTFDDGLEDFYTTALPLLKKYGFTASNAVITGMIGANEHMNTEQIKGSIKAGVEITSHTIGHLDLAKQSEAEVRRQVRESRDFLEKTFGIGVTGFVYPSGKYNDAVVRILAEEGYKIAVTVEYGEADLVSANLLLLSRVRIDNRDGFEGFVKKMEAVF